MRIMLFSQQPFNQSGSKYFGFIYKSSRTLSLHESAQSVLTKI